MITGCSTRLNFHRSLTNGNSNMGATGLTLNGILTFRDTGVFWHWLVDWKRFVRDLIGDWWRRCLSQALALTPLLLHIIEDFWSLGSPSKTLPGLMGVSPSPDCRDILWEFPDIAHETITEKRDISLANLITQIYHFVNIPQQLQPSPFHIYIPNS